MGRIVYAEACLLDYLTKLSDVDSYTVGLILGQSTANSQDYVIHLARTPPPASKDVVEETFIGATTSVSQESSFKIIKSVKDVPSSWVADHAKHVTRMLPGGMFVLGIFVVGPSDSLSDNDSINRLKSMISAIRKTFESHPNLHGDNPQDSLLLGFNSLTKKYVCKSYNTESLKGADWRFQQKITKWYQLETRVDFNQVFPVVDNQESEILKEQLETILRDTSVQINSSLVIIEGEKRQLEERVEVVANKKKKERKESKSNESSASDNSLQAAVYVPYDIKSEKNISQTSCSASIRLIGQIVSRIFLHQDSTIEDATNAFKQDIIRSMASRLEMHWDSLLEEENQLPEDKITLHEPPRRVLVPLPQSRITLSDYLFPGEGPQEALISLQELLDVEVQESSVQKELELQVDPSEFYSDNQVTSESTEKGKFVENNQYIVYVSGFVVAIIFLLIAILLKLFY